MQIPWNNPHLFWSLGFLWAWLEIRHRGFVLKLLVREIIRGFVVLDLSIWRLLRHIKKPRYRLEGACQKRGACCTQIIADPPRYLKQRPRLLRVFVLFHRWMHNFQLRARGPLGELVFRCGYLQPNGGCGIYRWRPRLCRVYPVLPFFTAPKLLPGCGYRTRLRGLNAHPRLPVLGGGAVGVHHPTPQPAEDGQLEREQDFVLIDPTPTIDEV